jgi:hypothetical protein
MKPSRVGRFAGLDDHRAPQFTMGVEEFHNYAFALRPMEHFMASYTASGIRSPRIS